MGMVKGESPEQVAHRVFIRSLIGKKRSQAWNLIVREGVKIVPALLDELNAALFRIENAPVGFSNGKYGPALGLVKKINPRDRALTKRIPEVMAAIVIDNEKARELVERHPVDSVRERCLRQVHA